MTVKYGEMTNLVNAVVSIDQYKPKIGEASETVVMAFEVDVQQAASDLSNLIETDVVESLDVDISQGPNTRGKHMVFVEFTRNSSLYENIRDILKVVSNVTTLTEWKFEYYKGEEVKDLNEENLKDSVIDNPQEYVLKYAQPKNENLDRVKQLAGL
tara:strand:- start:406 stop:873 length:468 start_codon:yes stop_codon:yes gene_type:complete